LKWEWDSPRLGAFGKGMMKASKVRWFSGAAACTKRLQVNWREVLLGHRKCLVVHGGSFRNNG
jgi:hypothetical protein